MLSELKQQVCQANLELVRFQLVSLTWGNVSGFDRASGLVVIKPSGVAYDQLQPEHMVVIDLEGNVVDGCLRPSSDTLTHIELYKAFAHCGGITHTHSPFATQFAQAGREIPCFGTTHADHFFGSIPLTRFLDEHEVANDYEKNTGRVIIERFSHIDPMSLPAVLVAGHGPFSWGQTAAESAKHSLILERVAEMAMGTILLNPDAGALPDYILKKHYFRKHGADAYYGQAPEPGTS